MPPLSVPPSSARAWIAAARLRTLPAAAAPVAVGTACAHWSGGVSAGPALAAAVGALALQVTSNFANDLFDAERGADGPDRVGPTRAVAAGWITAGAMRRATAVAIAVATACGLYLTSAAGWPVIAIGVAAILSALAYTGGPWPLGYHGLGEVFVFAFFGVVAVTGTTYVQRLEVPSIAWASSIPIGMLASAILVVNNVRDREGDARVGKRTLAVRLGRTGTIIEYASLVGGAYAAVLAMAVIWKQPSFALPLLTSPIAAIRIYHVARTDGPALNPLLAATAQLLLIFALLMVAGLVWGRQ